MHRHAQALPLTHKKKEKKKKDANIFIFEVVTKYINDAKEVHKDVQEAKKPRTTGNKGQKVTKRNQNDPKPVLPLQAWNRSDLPIP